MPVHALTTSAISSGPTSLRNSRRVPLRRLLARRPIRASPSGRQGFSAGGPIRRASGNRPRGRACRADCFSLIDAASWLYCNSTSIKLLADLLHVAQPALFKLPLLAQVGQLLAQLGHFLLDFLAALLGVLLGLVGQLAVGQFELHQPPLHHVDLAGHAFQFHRQPAGGLVHQVDGLVGQEAVGDIAVRKVGRRHEGRVLDPHALMMGLVTRLQTAEDGDRVLDRRLADHDRLESAFQGGVLFDVFAIFVERRGADASQLAAGQRGLQQIRGVAAAFGPAGADDRVQLVDEQNHVASVGHFAQHGLESLLELAAELRAGHQSAHVERDEPPILQAFGHVGVDDPQGKPLGDGRLAHARLADQDGIVFRPAREDLHDAADFLVATDHRIEFSLPGPLHQIDAVAFQRLKLAFRRLVGHPCAAADGLQHL